MRPTILITALYLAAALSRPSVGAAQTLAAQPEPAATSATPDRLDPLSRPAGLAVRGVPLARALASLSESSKIQVAFSPSLMDKNADKVTCDCARVSVREALDEMLRFTSFSYALTHGQVFVYVKQPLELPLEDPSVPQGAKLNLLAMASGPAVAPAGSVTGIITDRASGRPLPGAQVFIPGTGLGGLSNQQGRFLIPNVPDGVHTLRIEMLGYVTVTQSVTVQPGATVNLSFALEQTALALGEIVVTGVASATPKAELPFTVEQLDFSRELAVIPTSPQTMLQGRIAGASVISGSGQPGEDADIVFRAPTSITGGQGPLLIVDGVITSGRLSDINPRDIANIEIVKGAAAASLYGSRAQAGVINITTKRGAASQERTKFTFRTEHSANSMQHALAAKTHHSYKMTADGKHFADITGKPITNLNQRVQDDGGDGSNAWKTFSINPYPEDWPVISVVDQFFSPGNQGSIYGAVEGSSGNLSYRLSASVGKEEGVIKFHDGTRNKNFRLNLDHKFRPDLTISFSGYYANVNQDLIEQGTGGILRSLSTIAPLYNLLEIDPADCDLMASEGPPGAKTTNILYTLKTDQDSRVRDRFMGGLQGHFTPLSWLTFEGNASYDRSSVDERHIRPKGFKRMDDDGLPLPPDEGSYRRSQSLTEEQNMSLTASVNRSFGDFTSRSQFRYLYESRAEDGWSGGGTEFAVIGVPRLGLLKGSTQLDSYQSNTTAEGYFGITSLGYKSRYMVDLLLRRDGCSLFGSNERWQTYHRYSAAWRMSEEAWWPISWLTEFKPRYSVGTAGGRPRFEAQYQTYAVDRGQISPRILGNADLRPELATERELGLDLVVGQRLTANVSFIRTKVDDQLLLVPLPGYYGFTSQWQNAGTLNSKTWEATLEGALIQRENVVWTSFLNYSRSRQIISHLGVPPYQIRYLRSTMYVVEGEPLGSFYGKRWAGQCSDLGPSVNCADFDVNDDGYLVYVGAGNSWKDGNGKKLWGTVGQSNGKFYNWGSPLAALPWPEVVKMGDSEPDFNLSWGNQFRIGGLAINTLVEGVFGPSLYSTTLQWGGGQGEEDQASKPEYERKPLSYYFTLYDVNINNTHWVRDASFVKIREISARYTFSRNQTERLLGRLAPQDVTINLTGRNLHTWTPYEGYDPEVGQASFLGSAVVGRVDEYSYPNFRSFGVDVELSF